MENAINIMPYRLAENEIREWLTLFPLSDAEPERLYTAGEQVKWNGKVVVLEPFWVQSQSQDVLRNTFLNTASDTQMMINHLVFQIGQCIKGKEDVIIKSYPQKPKEDVTEPKKLRKSIVKTNKSGVWYTITQERDHWDYQFTFRVLLAFFDFVYQ